MSFNLEKDVKQFEDEIIRIRRKIHENPEISYKEFETSKLVAKKLREIGIQVRTGVGGTGVVGLLKGAPAGKVVALRADMDALPVTEGSDVPFKSKRSGVMHACGHDSHVAMLLGAAMLLQKYKDQLKGSVKFFFQPAEEDGGRGGAKPMIEDGAMENPRVDHVFGLHIGLGGYPSRTFALRAGPIMATPQAFEIRIIGKGGHGSRPHETIDPIFIGTQLIVGLQGISSRMISPIEPFVISICSFHSGTTDNVIPDEALMEGTIRAVEKGTMNQAKRNLIQISNSVCKAYGAKCVVNFVKDPYPVTVNDEKITRRVTQILEKIKGTKVVETPMHLGAEDVSRFLELAPGTYYFLGTRNPKKGCVYPNHSSKMKIDEDVLEYGSVSLAKLALEFTGTTRF